MNKTPDRKKGYIRAYHTQTLFSYFIKIADILSELGGGGRKLGGESYRVEKLKLKKGHESKL